MKTSIIILTHNQLEFTKLCLESIRAHTPEEYELIVVDNASTDGTALYLEPQNDVKLIKNRDNLGFAAGCNIGIKAATGDAILFLNNDTIVTDNWLLRMLEALRSDERIGMVGPVSNNVSGLQQIPCSYNGYEELQSFARENSRKQAGRTKRVLRLVGFCLLAKREVLNDIGWFDERFGIGMYEDDDLCLRAVQKEHHLAIAMDAFVHHIGHATFQGSGVQTAPLLQENRKKMAEKYGVDFTYYLHPRPDVIMLVPAGANRILDVGCAAGATGMELINRQDCELYGIEMQPEPASLAAQFYKAVHVEDVELFELPYPDHYFDAILFADVLEHLKDPWGTIRRYSRCLKPGGAIVASIPNVSHAEVLIQLLQGYWSYTDAGLLDRTHLRFFTRHTIKSLFPEDSFSIEQMMATTIPIVDEVERFLPELSKLANHYGLNVTYLEDDAHIYQFIVCAIKTADQG